MYTVYGLRCSTRPSLKNKNNIMYVINCFQTSTLPTHFFFCFCFFFFIFSCIFFLFTFYICWIIFYSYFFNSFVLFSLNISLFSSLFRPLFFFVLHVIICSSSLVCCIDLIPPRHSGVTLRQVGSC